MKKKRNIQFKTFGCRLNSFETEVMGKIAKSSDGEDVSVINTCAVTNEAVRKAKKTIRKMKRTTPANKIYVTGCAAQIEPKTFSSNATTRRRGSLGAATSLVIAAPGSRRCRCVPQQIFDVLLPPGIPNEICRATDTPRLE